MEIGAQLYTVRKFCKDINGFADTLKRVADIGYKNVQISGTCEFDPEWLKNELNKNGPTLSNAMHLSSRLGRKIILPFDEDLYYNDLMKRVASSKRKTNVKETVADTSGSYAGSK